MESKEGTSGSPPGGRVTPPDPPSTTARCARRGPPGPRRGDRPYGDFDLDLARNILEAAGMALANAQAFRRTQDRTVQGRHPGTWSVPAFRAFAETQMAVARATTGRRPYSS